MSLYTPAKFKIEDRDAILRLLRASPLATVISVAGGETLVSHVPLVAETSAGGTIRLVGHFARANPHAKAIATTPAKAIFHGPNAYITPAWYAENDVPTWNYATVHMSGNARLIEDRLGIEDCLRKLSDFAEAGAEKPWEFWVPDDLSAVLEKAIVGFEIEVQSIEAKFKLNQNRSEEDRRRVIARLKEQGDDMSRAVSELMEKTFS